MYSLKLASLSFLVTLGAAGRAAEPATERPAPPERGQLAPEATPETPWAAEVKVGARREAWTLATDDTRLTVGVTADHQLCLFELSSLATGWNWTAAPSAFPLLEQVDMAGVQYRPAWVYQEGTVDRGDGTKVTLRFTNQQPPLELKSVWHARSGPGPIRHTMFISKVRGVGIRSKPSITR